MLSSVSGPGFHRRPARHVWSALTIAVGTSLNQLGATGALAQEPVTEPSTQAEVRQAISYSPAYNDGEVTQIGVWIEQLNHDAYPVRQAAAEQLLDAGMPARGLLLDVADGPDPETRAAARRLVALIDRSEFHRRLEAFARDEDGSQGLTLPGWELFRERIGNDSAARALFVDMQRQEGALLAAVFGVSPPPLDGIWEERLMRLVQWQATGGERSGIPPLGTCATMLFLGSAPELDVSERGAVLVENLIQRPPLRENMQAGNYRDAVRRLVVNWIMYCPNQNEVILNRRLYLASMNQLQESLPMAFDVALGEGKYSAVQSPTRAAAVLLVGQLGSRQHVERLEALLDDATVCAAVGPGQAATSVQLRDVALVVMLHLSGQRPADYGYVNARMQPQQMFQLQTLSAENDQQRDEAIAKWRAWWLEHEHDEPGADETANDASTRRLRLPTRIGRPGTALPASSSRARR